MRFIGNKTNLLDEIKKVIDENCTDSNSTFCDIFSGTGSVSRYFKPYYKIISNDLMYFSYLLTSATINNNEIPNFPKLKNIGINDPISFLEEQKLDANSMNGFVTTEYSPQGENKRMYLTIENAQRIDSIRQTIEKWNKKKLISTYEYNYLIACLIEGVPYVSNITGTYGAYLKNWDKRAFKKYEMYRLSVYNNNQENECYNEDANELIKKINGDILYLDPPYNERQYLPNYHVLESIAKYDCPSLKGITGMRPYSDVKSEYCIKNKVFNAFEKLISNAKFKHIIISYSDDGLLTVQQIIEILSKYCVKESIKQYNIPYARYRAKLPQSKKDHNEYIFYAKKNITTNSTSIKKDINSKENFMIDKKKFIKSPMNYIGGKYKLLPQLFPLFPTKINTFVDLFAGGFNVSANINANKLICNDMNNLVVEMVETICSLNETQVLSKIKKQINAFNLTIENEEGYKKFREFYNITHDPIDLFTLSCFSFNYQFRFNSNKEYNNPFGKNRSRFSDRTEKNLLLFMKAMKEKNIVFMSKDFRDISIDNLGENDFIYCDPPYLITNGSYNDGNRGFHDWKIQEEKDLYSLLDRANERGIKFALSNVIKHKGTTNEILSNWSTKYKVHYIDSNYNNCNYHIKNKDEETIEVLITNY